jgi:hypothetical protein
VPDSGPRLDSVEPIVITRLSRAKPRNALVARKWPPDGPHAARPVGTANLLISRPRCPTASRTVHPLLALQDSGSADVPAIPQGMAANLAPRDGAAPDEIKRP